MIVEVYQYKDLAVYIRDNRVELTYFEDRYSEEVKGTIVETLCNLLNRISVVNTLNIYAEIRCMISFTELSNTQTISFDGMKYYVESVEIVKYNKNKVQK